MRALLVPFALLALACSPDIGDACETSTDCSQSGDRLCDVSQRDHGGYCTVFDCEPGSCPDEAACVLFGLSPSTAPECRNESGNNPSQRSFCMKKCNNSSDCRTEDGYVCEAPDGIAASNVDRSGKVCMLPQSGASVPVDRPGDVCTGVIGSSGGTGGTRGDGGTSEGGQGGEGGAGSGA